MKKISKYNDEIDLTEFFSSIKKNIWIIISITTIAVAIGYINTLNEKIVYKVKTEVKGISYPEELKYENFNTYLKGSFSNLVINLDTSRYQNDITFYNFTQIDKKILFDLFIDKLSDKTSLIKILKNSELISRESYQNRADYEEAVENLSSKINLRLPSSDSRQQFRFVIETETSDLENWKNFLIFINDFINKEIQNELKMKFTSQLENAKIIKKYQIEDLQNELTNLSNIIKISKQNTDYIKDLISIENIKKSSLANLVSERHLQRIRFLFDTTPVIKSNDFRAATVIYSNPKINEIKNLNRNSIIIAYACIGLIISIFYIYILNGLKKRK